MTSETMSMSAKRALVTLAVLLTAGLCGCGSEEPSSPAPVGGAQAPDTSYAQPRPGASATQAAEVADMNRLLDQSKLSAESREALANDVEAQKQGLERMRNMLQDRYDTAPDEASREEAAAMQLKLEELARQYDLAE